MADRLARIFVRFNTYFERFQKLQKGIYQGIWLGLLRPETLLAVTDQYYTSVWGRYHSRAHNLSGLFEWEKRIITQYYQNCQQLLIGSVGGGREVLALAKLGYQIDAFECAELLFSECQQLIQQEALSAQVFPALPNSVPELPNKYTGAIIGWGSYIHMPGRDRRIQLLKQYHHYLQPHAPLLLSFFVRPTTTPQQYLTYRVARLVGWFNPWGYRVELGDMLPDTFDHSFTCADIESELAAGGFQLIEFSAEHTPSNSAYPYAVARKVD